MGKVKILFVCMANICRSPTAQGVLRAQLKAKGLTAYFEVDSAGTHAYHEGETPDPRAQAAARLRGVEISDLKARMVQPDDFARFDYILGMDRENFARLHRMREQTGGLARVEVVMAYAPPGHGKEIGDPYFGGGHGFERVLDQLEVACDGLIDTLCRRHDIAAKGNPPRT